ncbi:hypothetical protein K469DRAFT_785976 [Zopfia rhizophila CBS 207.26]|uniref:Uncharacterized protein n=1 Tax=Zopfia rhizophila CBS 207.26 TaxID=1314779 RepID=A0A6A6DYR6_9PEZI|nr:hypothetical protein K469DRAFT_785976 [Zopfia rhizophila CBS 207.26]
MAQSESISPLDAIFSCSVCYVTFPEVYEVKDTIQGLSDGTNPKDHLVTKLWLGSCCHVFCNKHIEGGGPPFHPQGQRPRAPCPLCVTEKGDNKPQELYPIRGFKEGEYDKAIPACWFVTPPIKLDSSGAEMEALRFQYVSLIRYTKQVTSNLRQTRGRLAEAQHGINAIQRLGAEEHSKFLALKEEFDRLRAKEPELKKFKDRMPAINHYLNLIPKMAEQIEHMRQQLASVGIQVPEQQYTYNKSPYPFDENGNAISHDASQPGGGSLKRTMSSHTAGRSANTPQHPGGAQLSSSPQLPPYKRLRPNNEHAEQNIHAAPIPKSRLDSRDLMPPPSAPISRMKSIRKLWRPRKKESPGQPVQAYSDGPDSTGDVQMYNNGHWQNVDRPSRSSFDNDKPPTHGHIHSEDSYYMRGALPAGQAPRLSDTPQPRLAPVQSAAEIEDDNLYRFPTKPLAPQGRDPPAEPSYIRLLDDLSRDTGLELDLRDPRQDSPIELQRSHRGQQSLDINQSRAQNYKNEQPKRWNFGHAFLHQSPTGQASPNYHYPDPLRSNPVGRDSNNSIKHPALASITPVPRRAQQPSPRAESVVSPFFKTSNCNSQTFSRAGIAELEASSLHSDGYRFQRPRIAAVHSGWHEPRSLNGLSFFNSPRDTRNEPIEYDSGYARSNYLAPPQQHYSSRNLNSQGFITRPDTSRSPYANQTISYSRPAYSRQAPAPPQSAIPFPSTSRQSHSRAAPLPSALPSIVSSHRPHVRSSRSQLDGLTYMGVRTGRPSQSQTPGYAITPSRGPFSSAGRRSVRR